MSDLKGLNKIWGGIRSLFTFTPQQIRGLLWLLPLLAILSVLMAVANRPRFEKSFLELADEAVQQESRFQDSGQMAVSGDMSNADDAPPTGLFNFDPNTVTLQELVRLGFDARTAAGIIKYRRRGKRFEIPEDFATCYGVSVEQYTRLEPHIVIAEEFRAKNESLPGGLSAPKKSLRQQPIPAIEPFDPNGLDAAGFVSRGFSPAQADVIVRYRESIGGFRAKEDFAECYVVSENMMERLEPFMMIAPPQTPAAIKQVAADKQLLEINSADSTALRHISGIGEVLVTRILEYRKKLGGFHSADQLAEVKGMSEANWELICKQIRVDSCVIQKNDINFAPHKTLVETMGQHPYVTDAMLRKLLKNRQLKGGWSTIGDMVEENIMTRKEAERLSPYLVFRSE